MSTIWSSASSSCAPPPARWRSHARAAIAGGCVRGDRGLPARARLLRCRAARTWKRTSISATASREPLRRTTAPPPPEPCPLPLAAVSVRDTTGSRPRTRPHRRVGADVEDAEYAEAVEAVRAAIGRGDVYQVNLVQHLSAPFDGDPRRLAALLRRFDRPRPSSPATAGRSSPPRPSSSSPAAGAGSGRARSRGRGRSASTWRARRTRPST